MKCGWTVGAKLCHVIVSIWNFRRNAHNVQSCGLWPIALLLTPSTTEAEEIHEPLGMSELQSDVEFPPWELDNGRTAMSRSRS